ncbi:MAG: hypothetical protein BWK79_10685 [Beggiatoa sp. IS2]|nr:MAG: hypothetical protein BWK79_10685 [Beggiatoa sp. IS2]
MTQFKSILFIFVILGLFQVYSAAIDQTVTMQGYIEGEFLRPTAPLAGILQTLAVKRGMTVEAGTLLFTLNPEPEATAVKEAEQKLLAAQAHLRDLQKGQRPLEIKALEARKIQAQTDLELAKIEQIRYETLFRQKVGQKEVLDTARATTERSQARLEEVTAQLEIAKLAAREDTRAVAEAEVALAQAVLEKSKWWLTQKQVIAPEAGQIVDIFYYAGEWVPAGGPVLSLLPPERIKVRFFAPGWLLGDLTVGRLVELHCDGCPKRMDAMVNYIAAQAEYTPPVIYSRDSRTKLVYGIEASVTPENAVKLHPGQPVDVLYR